MGLVGETFARLKRAFARGTGSDRVRAEEIVRALTQPKSEGKNHVYELNGKIVEGKLDLKHHTVEVAVEIRNCEFLEEVDLRYCEFEQAVDLSGCTFRERFDSGNEVESHTIYRKDLNCNGAVFEGPLGLNGGVVEGSAYFNGARFLNEERSVFAWTSVGKALECDETFFKGEANFHALQCGGSAFLRQATFEGEVNLAFASFGGNLDFQSSIFKGKSNFNTLQCGGSAFFNPARFEEDEEEVDFAFASFGVNLNLRGATFAAPVNLEEVSVSRQLHLDGATFEQDVILYQSKIGTLSVGDALPFGQDSRVDLRGCRFDSFYSEKPQLARALAKRQRPEKFSRDPYLHLERYYRDSGNEVEAKRIHLEGRKALARNAWKGEGRTQWSPPTKVADAALWLLTGYGVRTWRLLVPIVFFLVVGTCMFWPTDALSPTSSGGPSASNETQVAEAHLVSAQSEEEPSSGDPWQHLFDRGSYSLDLFLPVVNLHLDENWEPNGLGRQMYAVVHSMVGWVLVPLLLASLAGIVRRE